MSNSDRSNRLWIFAFAAVAALAAAATVFGFGVLRARLAPPADRSLNAVLPNAEWVHVFRTQPKVEIPITNLGPGADENPAMFDLLKAGTRPRPAAPSGTPDLYFNVRFRPRGAGHGVMARYGYYLKTGVVGDGGQWGTVPNRFRLWMRRMDASVPRKEYGIGYAEGRKVLVPLPDSPKTSK